MAPLWCIECWGKFRQRTEAVGLIHDDPYCELCAQRLGPLDDGEDIEVIGPEQPDGERSGEAGAADLGEPSASPLKKVGSAQFSVVSERQEKTSMPKRVTIDWAQYDRLRPDHTSAEIASKLGVGKSTLERHVDKRAIFGGDLDLTPVKRGRPRKTQPGAAVPQGIKCGGGTGSASPLCRGRIEDSSEVGGSVIEVPIPESTLNHFLVTLPLERKIGILLDHLRAAVPQVIAES